jgi:hypothetical protein
LKNRIQIKELMLKGNKDITLFCGHYHLSDKRSQKNITQLITSAASYQIEMDPENLKTHNQFFGYRIISIQMNKIDSSLIKLTR